MNAWLGWVGLVAMVGCSGTTSASGSGSPGDGGADGDDTNGVAGASSSTSGAPGQGGTNQVGGRPAAGGTGGGSAGSAGVSAGSGGVPPNPGGSCEDFTPCGGDVVGTRSIQGCITPDFEVLQGLCAEATTKTTITGTAAFLADGTMTVTQTADVASTVPANCDLAPMICTGESAAQLELDCDAEPGGGCVCHSTGVSGSQNATYTTTGAGFITTINNGEASDAQYCRAGNELWVRSGNPNGSTVILRMTKQ